MEARFPDHLWTHIMRYLGRLSRLPLMQTCRRLRDLALTHAWPPWDGNGLWFAAFYGFHDYYCKWSARGCRAPVAC